MCGSVEKFNPLEFPGRGSLRFVVPFNTGECVLSGHLCEITLARQDGRAVKACDSSFLSLPAATGSFSSQ